jgi:hypothetical protein
MKTVKEILVEKIQVEPEMYGDFDDFIRDNIRELCDALPEKKNQNDDDAESEEVFFENINIVSLNENLLAVYGGADWQNWIYAEFIAKDGKLYCSNYKITDSNYGNISEEEIAEVLGIDLNIFDA